MADTVTGTLSSSSSKYHVQPSLLPPATQNVRTFEQALSGEQTGRAKPAFPTPEQYQEALSWSEGQSLESAKARMAFVRPLVEAIIPDIQGIGDNAAKAQQSWNNGQYLSATENAGVVLVGMAENLPALKAAKAAGKVDNLLPTHIPDATTRAVQSAGSAKAAADIAQQAGRASGAAAELRVNGQVFTDVSTGGAARDLHPSVKSGLDQVPLSQRAPWHGHCAEAGCVSQALEAGVNPAGGTSKAVNIGTSGKGHGTPKPACTSCQHLLDQFGVKHD